MRGYYGEDAADQPKPRVQDAEGRPAPRRTVRADRLAAAREPPPVPDGRRGAARRRVVRLPHLRPRASNTSSPGWSRVEVLDLYCKSYEEPRAVRAVRTSRTSANSASTTSAVARGAAATAPTVSTSWRRTPRSRTSRTSCSTRTTRRRMTTTTPHLVHPARTGAGVVPVAAPEEAHPPATAALGRGRRGRARDHRLRHPETAQVARPAPRVRHRRGRDCLRRARTRRTSTSIDLSRNAVTAKGLSALRKAGINAVANKPLTADELEEREYLREGDFE